MEDKMMHAIHIAKMLFDRGTVTGSAANLSFREQDNIYITASGTCFGILTPDDFSVLDLQGNHVKGKAPSKEYPLHLMMYNGLDQTGAVIHTHSLYAVLWSCLKQRSTTIEPWPSYTPYLQMRLGSIGRIPYHKPGSSALFETVQQTLDQRRAYLLENHGPIIAAKDLYNAFYDIEELEASAQTAWLLRGQDAASIEV